MDESAELIESNLQSQEVTADEVTTEPFIGRWNKLVSQTNWEKGRIIFQWREAMQEAGATAADYSDDAWSRIVGGVTPQHVGRLRRVYQRFVDSYQEYAGLYWSHFFAAVEWDDAEMWLEGAVQNQWSVANMRDKRSETLGGVPEESFSEPVSMENDEDFQPLSSVRADDDDPKAYAERLTVSDSSSDEGSSIEDAGANSSDPWEPLEEAVQTADPVRPFAGLPELPDDLAEAFESCKLSILAHKAKQWNEVPRDDVLVALDSLKALVVLQS